MIPFSIGNVKMNLPSSWEEITTKQMIEIKKTGSEDFCSLLSILTGVDYKTIYNADISEFTVDQLSAGLEWMKTSPDFINLDKPETLTIGGKTMAVVNNLSVKTLGQKIFFEQKIFPFVKAEGDVVVSIDPEAIPIALAIYFQPLYTGHKFNPDEIDSMVALCGEVPVTQAFPVANFFLKKYFDYESSKKSSISIPKMTTSQPDFQTLNSLAT